MEIKKEIDIVRFKAIDLVKEGVISYSNGKISSPKDCYELARKNIDDCDREMFIAIVLDIKKSTYCYTNYKYRLFKY